MYGCAWRDRLTRIYLVWFSVWFRSSFPPCFSLFANRRSTLYSPYRSVARVWSQLYGFVGRKTRDGNENNKIPNPNFARDGRYLFPMPKKYSIMCLVDQSLVRLQHDVCIFSTNCLQDPGEEEQADLEEEAKPPFTYLAVAKRQQTTGSPSRTLVSLNVRRVFLTAPLSLPTPLHPE